MKKRNSILKKVINKNISEYRTIILLSLIFILIFIFFAGKVVITKDESLSIIYGRNYCFSKFIEIISEYETHPPLYFTIIWLMNRINNSNIYWLRSFSLLCSIGILFFVFKISLKFYGKRTAIIASLFFILCSVNIFFSIFIRSYSLFAFLVIYAFYIVIETKETVKNSILLTMICCLMIYTHYLAVIPLVTLFLVSVIFLKKEKILKLFLVFLIIPILSIIPWILNTNISPFNNIKILKNNFIDNESLTIERILSFFSPNPFKILYFPVIIFIIFIIVYLFRRKDKIQNILFKFFILNILVFILFWLIVKPFFPIQYELRYQYFNYSFFIIIISHSLTFFKKTRKILIVFIFSLYIYTTILYYNYSLVNFSYLNNILNNRKILLIYDDQVDFSVNSYFFNCNSIIPSIKLFKIKDIKKYNGLIFIQNKNISCSKLPFEEMFSTKENIEQENLNIDIKYIYNSTSDNMILFNIIRKIVH